MSDKATIANLFRLLAATVEGLDQQQLDALLAGTGKLTFAVTRTAKEKSTTAPLDHATILEELNGCKDRLEAGRVLSRITGRDALAALARTLRVHVIKNDRREDVESKIIEFVIGGKLRTEAIQSLNMKGGTTNPSEET